MNYIEEIKVGTTRNFTNIDFSEDEGIWFKFRILKDNRYTNSYLKICFEI